MRSPPPPCRTGRRKGRKPERRAEGEVPTASCCGEGLGAEREAELEGEDSEAVKEAEGKEEEAEEGSEEESRAEMYSSSCSNLAPLPAGW